MGLISELRHRNVLRMAVLYAFGAWLVMQVVEAMMAVVGLPAWAGRATFALLAVGFPITLILSWFYEITPEGISLEKNVDRAESITHVTGRRLICFNNPVPEDWKPMPETCEGVVAQRRL